MKKRKKGPPKGDGKHGVGKTTGMKSAKGRGGTKSLMKGRAVGKESGPKAGSRGGALGFPKKKSKRGD
jgi:hypothetical protein